VAVAGAAASGGGCYWPRSLRVASSGPTQRLGWTDGGPPHSSPGRSPWQQESPYRAPACARVPRSGCRRRQQQQRKCGHSTAQLWCGGPQQQRKWGHSTAVVWASASRPRTAQPQRRHFQSIQIAVEAIGSMVDRSTAAAAVYLLQCQAAARLHRCIASQQRQSSARAAAAAKRPHRSHSRLVTHQRRGARSGTVARAPGTSLRLYEDLAGALGSRGHQRRRRQHLT
jgi:hypothetical protein